jgi:hypothetical protein
MSNQYMELDQLLPHQALDILAQVAEPDYIPYLQDTWIATVEQSLLVSLFVPQKHRKGRRQKQISEQFQQLVQERCEAITGQPPLNDVHLPDTKLSLQEGAGQLIYRTHDQKWQKELDFVAGEYLLVGIDKQIAETAELFEQLRVHATQTETSISIVGDKTYTIFHVADDQARGSTFSGLEAAGLLKDWVLLYALQNGAYRLFVPPTLWPKPEAVATFCYLLQNSPQLFSNHPPRLDHKLLAALVQEPEINAVTLLFLRNLLFADRVKLSPSVAKYARFTICELADSPQKMEQLHEEIQSLEHKVGYRLELRKTRFKENIEAERERLQREWHELEYEIELLNAYKLPHPLLLRFTSSQLTAFGDFLSRLPGTTLRDGKLLYGFQATDQHPQGLHFIYLDPMIVKQPDLDPLLNWRHLDAKRPMRFWLDPFWAIHYNDKNQSKLFVPEHTTLFPAIHDWNVEAGEMDDYLQKVINHWLQEQSGTGSFQDKSVPQIPIYIFDGPTDTWGDMDVYILDRAAFEPLQTHLGWLNDNLVLQKARVVKAEMTEVAADLVWASIAQQVSQRKDEVKQTFAATSSQLTQGIAEHTAVLMKTLTDKLEQLQAATNTQRQAIGELQIRLDQMTALYHQLADTVQQAQKSEAAIRDQMSSFQQTEKALKEEVEEFRQKVKETIEQVSQEIDDLVTELKETYQREDKRLHNLRWSRRR